MTKTNKVFAVISLSIASAWCLWQGSGSSVEPSIDRNIRPVANNESAGPKTGIPIEQIRVGMRVAAMNPELTETDRAGFIEPDQATWRLMKLEMEKADGGLLEIDLIRPEEWIRDSGAFRGGQMYLDMPELGAKGLARVLHIGQCPKIEPGEGQVVISTFAHPASHKILDVTFGDIPSTLNASSSLQPEDSSLSPPIGVTATHPFWSESRQAYVPIGEMQVGERVVTFHGETKQITSILARPGPPEKVYNLEVNGEHTYFVGGQQLLVHNNGCKSLLIGTDVRFRLTTASRQLGARLIKVVDPGSWTTAMNARWIGRQISNMESGRGPLRRILDIGDDFGNVADDAAEGFYATEVRILKERGYARSPVEGLTVTIDEQIVQVFEWIKRIQ